MIPFEACAGEKTRLVVASSTKHPDQGPRDRARGDMGFFAFLLVPHQINTAMHIDLLFLDMMSVRRSWVSWILTALRLFFSPLFRRT